MPVINILLANILLFYTLSNNTENPIFISPLKIPVSFSSNFGELRVDHFHSGVDIKTQGATGKEVVAPADGYVYRISITPSGFGNALYLRHPSGYSTVYGHLEKFIPAIQEYVINQQYSKKSFNVTLYPPADKFVFKQGDLIAYSGNSGGSSGPHLHYEMRKTENENPVNPLLFDFGIKDDIKPILEKLFIYPAASNTSIEGENKLKRINITGSQGNYSLSTGELINISGKASFGLKAYDLFNDSNNKCAVYSIELKVDSTTVFKYVMDEFSYNETRFVNAHIDYEIYIKERTYIERLFSLPNDKLGTYKTNINRGIIDFDKEKEYNIQLIVSDIHGNKSRLSFIVKNNNNLLKPVKSRENISAIMPYNRTNRFRAEGVSLTIPTGALYDTLFFEYKRNRGNEDMYSDVYYIHNKFTPVQKGYSLSIKPGRIPVGKESKLLLIQLSEDNKKSPVSSTFNEGYVTGDALSFGMFFVGIDTIAPGIYTNGLTDGIDMSGKNEIRIRIDDNLSGIKSYEPSIDGKWALFEYDQKNSTIIYRFDSKRITKGTDHNLSLKVIDNKDNFNTYNLKFRW